MARILIVEDERPIASVLRRGLEEARFEVDVAADGHAGLRQALEGGYSLIILDVMLPGIDGWAVCEQLRRRRSAVPVLMLTARDDVGDRVRGLELGADDYLPKPFDFAELLARVRALLRRDKIHRARVIRIGPVEIDTTAGTARKDQQPLSLTALEYRLLELLAANEGRIMSRESIQDRLWGEEEVYSNVVDVHIGLLRKKIESATGPKLIHTVHRMGYVMRSPEEEPTAGAA